MQKATKAVKNPTDRPKRGKRKLGHSRYNCPECGCADLPKKMRGPDSASETLTHWIQCEFLLLARYVPNVAKEEL